MNVERFTFDVDQLVTIGNKEIAFKALSTENQFEILTIKTAEIQREEDALGYDLVSLDL